MKSRKPSAQRPLVPDICGDGYVQSPAPTRAEMQALYAQLSKYKNELAIERKRHIKLEGALSRYQSILEKQITELTAAVDALRQELLTQFAIQLRPRSAR